MSSVDDYLGPAERRFFGKGFRRVEYGVRDVRVAAAADGGLRAEAVVGVRYPADWSKKAAGTDLRPHFSTVDGLVLAVQLAELCLAGPGGDTSVAARGRLRKVRITAGGTPQEELDRLPARASRRRVEPYEGGAAGEAYGAAGGLSVSVFDCAIGTMRVQCEIVHPAFTPPVGDMSFAHPSALLGPDTGRYFGTGFTTRRQYVRDVEVDHEQLSATARLSVVAEAADGSESAPGRPSAGLGAAHEPAVSMVDAFVTALQLAQVMLYEHDGVNRKDSNTLWMRQTVMTAPEPPLPHGAEAAPVTTRLADLGLLRLGGGLWRTLDVVAEMAGIHVRSAVTHRLPESYGDPTAHSSAQ
uniref:AvrD family protein n=1 Tax=Streptomyces sp. NBC_00049 TaxID=2903617 RepID=A0AAU2JRY0_9ACTN